MVSEKSYLTVIIPSFNRADALPETLRSLSRQSLGPKQFEVIIVDDNSTDGSARLVQELQKQLPYCAKLIQQDRQGPGAARNRGVKAANYDLLLFWDSDMVADPRTLQLHVELQAERGPVLMAGARRPWQPACTSTFDQIMNLAKLEKDQFHATSPSFQEAFTCNLSIQRADFWRLGGFDESLWAFEDSDLAYRAQQAGLPLIFSREAVGYHNHPMSLEQACQHQRHYQKHAALFFHKHPELEGQIRYLVDKGPVNLDKDPPGLVMRKIVRRVVASHYVLHPLKTGVTFLENHYPNPSVLTFLYWKILASYQLIGYREGLKQLIQETTS